jgi:hypothetical protein
LAEPVFSKHCRLVTRFAKNGRKGLLGLFILEKGKPVERPGRKAKGLNRRGSPR